MPKQLFVSNLSPATTSPQLTGMFAAHGAVRWAEVLPPSPRGGVEETSGLVEMASDAEADGAVAAMDGRAHGGRNLTVRVATSRQKAGAAEPPQFGAMNMPDDGGAVRVNPGPAKLDFGDRFDTDRNRGLPLPGEPEVCPPSTDSGDWTQFVPLASAAAPFRPARPDPTPPAGDGERGLDAAQRATFDAVFSHPLPRGLRWPEVRSMLGALAALDLAPDGSMRVVRNGHAIDVPRPAKNVATAQDVMDLRRFLERSETRRQ